MRLSLTVVLFFGGPPFALLCFNKELLSALLFFSKHVMRVALNLAHCTGPPRLVALAVAHLSSSRTVPWP
jgi:hypothetical protein